MNCLLIIDVQKGFMTTPEARALPGKINRLVKGRKFDHIIATKHINYKGSCFDYLMGYDGMMDAASQELAGTLDIEMDEVFIKDTYTCYNEDLKASIVKNNIDEIYICGMDTDACVLKTCMDLFEHGVKAYLLADCCASGGGVEIHEAALRILERNVGKERVIREVGEKVDIAVDNGGDGDGKEICPIGRAGAAKKFGGVDPEYVPNPEFVEYYIRMITDTLSRYRQDLRDIRFAEEQDGWVETARRYWLGGQLSKADVITLSEQWMDALRIMRDSYGSNIGNKIRVSKERGEYDSGIEDYNRAKVVINLDDGDKYWDGIRKVISGMLGKKK